MNQSMNYCNEKLTDIGYLGDILDALDSIPDDKTDSVFLLRGAAAIGRHIVRLATEAGELGGPSGNARHTREALSDVLGFGEVIGALDAVPASKQDATTLLCASAALGRRIASLAIDASGSPAAESDVVDVALAVAEILDAAEKGIAPPAADSWIYGAFLKDFRVVENGGVRFDGRFFSCAAMQPLHGERVAALIPRVGHLTRLLILDLDGGLIGVAKVEAPGVVAERVTKAAEAPGDETATSTRE